VSLASRVTRCLSGPLIVGGLWVAACAPVVDLGSTATDADASSTSGNGPTGGGTTESSTSSDAQSGGITSGAVDETATTAADATGDGSDGSTGATTRCELAGDAACVACARRQCCDEVLFCQTQPMCSCFLECIAKQTPMDCMAKCEFVSGVAAVNACLGMSCGAECG
jgi:hypothetical protein